jgi:predicted nucleic acid-binding protein
VADVYLDACCFIYLIEGEPGWQAAIEKRLRDLDPVTRLITSQISRLECRTKPTKDRDHALLERYDTLFGASRVVVLDVSESIIDRATTLRARHGLKSPDAIHLATAVECGASAFWTGDSALERCTEVEVSMLTQSAV